MIALAEDRKGGPWAWSRRESPAARDPSSFFTARKIGSAVSDSYETSMSVPLDRDGFIRRECPTCERELKWLAQRDEDEDVVEALEGGYYCPYCAVQAPPDAWWTKQQLEKAKSILMEEVVGPALDKLTRDVKGMNRPGGFIQVSVERDEPQPVDELTETDDMRRVDFGCHSAAPVKVLDDWAREVHCPICGAAVEPG